MRTALPFAAAALLLISACGPSDPAPAQDPADVVTPADGGDTPPSTVPLFDAAALGVPDDVDSINDGRAIAETYCAACHGLDNENASRLDAPPLRHILSLYPPESLAEDFRSGIHVGHQDMPDFVFGPLGMDVLLAYLVSIQEAPPASLD